MAVLACAVAAPPAPARAPALPALAARCGDLLARLGKKPPLARYAGCRAQPDRQGKPLRATYRVFGRDAAQVEAFLVRKLGMRPLDRVCCIWETRTLYFKDTGGAVYSIVMGSEETLVHSRAQWHAIPVFEIVVERDTEDI